MFLGADVGFDVGEGGTKAVPSFPGEELELLKEEPEELRGVELSSLSWNLFEDDALKEDSKGLVGTFDCMTRDLGLRLKAGRSPPPPPKFPLSLFLVTGPPKFGFKGVVVVEDGGKGRGSDDSEPVRRWVDDGTAKECSSRR